MPPNFTLLHGLAASPDLNWFRWLGSRLEARGCAVCCPALPNSLVPDRDKWMKAAAPLVATWDKDTVVVAHSLGGALALRLLALPETKPVRAVVTVATPFASPARFGWLTGFFDEPVDWEKLRRRAGIFVTVHAKNDPLVPFDHSLRYAESLGSRLVLTDKGGHFTGRTAPLVWEEVEKLL